MSFEALHDQPTVESERIDDFHDAPVDLFVSREGCTNPFLTSRTYVEPPIQRCRDGPTMAVILWSERRLTSVMAPLSASQTEMCPVLHRRWQVTVSPSV